MNYIVLDLEATCWQGHQRSKQQEVIEIGAFLVNPYGEVLSSYNRFVRPILHPRLSAYCTELTTIQQENVDRAKKFGPVIEEFQDWAEIYEENYMLCSWGAFDKKILIHDCQLHDIEEEWLEHFIDLKQQYREIKRLSHPIGLKAAIRHEGFEFEGIHHRAITDAQNLVKIFQEYRDVWRV